ncbi:uncharacterized protein LOC123530011 [Mercenaria mercenaria]|uniref:uncharacterized protein LOC123530011 n=1 Tax=Mercenaria mercenaria TaxID=6596 RepID=UPI00234E97E0|nr:uncharacterized protein LOC123530011 [Mercenaria mercenaria]XP_045166627.2 uncharacterized protein LOC123530011 [Mercenaria mercenaria]
MSFCNYRQRLFKKMKNFGPFFLRVGSVLLICLCFVVYLNWEMVPMKNTQVNFTAIRTDDYIQLVPKVNMSNSDVSMKITKTYNTQDGEYDLRIIVIVYNRAHSLMRLLKSLNEAEYGSDSVKLEVWIDRSQDQTLDTLTFQSASGFIFYHGQYSVIPHPRHVGLYGQWLTTWKPKINSSEIAVILEDDLTVSPHFYKYLKNVHRKYDGYPDVNGYALQGSSIKHSNKDNSRLQGPKDSLVYLYPVLGTWGFSPNRKNWMKFLDWFPVAHNDKNYQPYVPDNVVTDWYKAFQKEGKTQGMWSIWHIHYAWKNNEYTLYSNFEDHAGLTTNWQEDGLHYQNVKKVTNKLLTEWKPEYENLPDKLVHLDIAGKVISS